MRVLDGSKATTEMSTTKGATSLQKQREKKRAQLRQEQERIEKIREEQHRKAMVKSFRALTALLGKLGIAKDKFVVNHDENVRKLGFAIPKPRPPWKEGIEYGLSLSEAVTWVKKYVTSTEYVAGQDRDDKECSVNDQTSGKAGS